MDLIYEIAKVDEFLMHLVQKLQKISIVFVNGTQRARPIVLLQKKGFLTCEREFEFHNQYMCSKLQDIIHQCTVKLVHDMNILTSQPPTTEADMQEPRSHKA